MKRALAVILAAAIASPGCAVRRPSNTKAPAFGAAPVTSSGPVQAKHDTDQAAWERYLNNLPIGAKVKVEMRDGASFKGIYMGVENGQITVKPRTRIPEPVRVVPIASLALVELDQGSSTGRTVAIAAGVAAASVLAMLLTLAAVIDD